MGGSSEWAALVTACTVGWVALITSSRAGRKGWPRSGGGSGGLAAVLT